MSVKWRVYEVSSRCKDTNNLSMIRQKIIIYKRSYISSILIKEYYQASHERLRHEMAQMSGSEADRKIKDLEAQLAKLGNVLGLNVIR